MCIMFWTRTIVNFVILTSNIATISIFWNPIGAGAQDEIGDFDYENICSENDTLVENYDYFNITETTGEDGNRRLLIQQASSRVSRDPEVIKFYLYRDPRNPNTSQELILNNPSSVQNSRFDTNQKTVFVIHGYQNNGNSAMGYLLRKRFFDANLIYNVIIVDWGKLSTPQPGDPWHFTYPTIATRSVPIAATRVANFIQFLLNNRFTTLDRIHLIGHSLGAHVSGRAGGEVTSSNGDRKLSRISGLDPAGPSFGSNGQRRLSESDAEFVDVYHTNAGDLLGGHAGINVYNLGHANYLVNGGQTQPGCDFISNINSCSHSFAYIFYAASIQRDYFGCRCANSLGSVSFCTDNNCDDKVLAGYRTTTETRGQFFVATGNNPFTDQEPLNPAWIDPDYTIKFDEAGH